MFLSPCLCTCSQGNHIRIETVPSIAGWDLNNNNNNNNSRLQVTTTTTPTLRPRGLTSDHTQWSVLVLVYMSSLLASLILLPFYNPLSDRRRILDDLSLFTSVNGCLSSLWHILPAPFCDVARPVFPGHPSLLRGFAKLKKFQKSKKKLDRAQPTHPPTLLSKYFFFFETHPWHGQNRIYRQNKSYYAQTT